MTTGLRPITDARGRVFTHPAVQAAWLSIDCGFPAVADVFEECCRDALNQLDEVQFSAYVDLARHIGNLGRGAEPLLAFIEEWPSVIEAAPGDSAQLTELLLHAIDRMQRSPNSRAITPFIQTLAPVAKRLRSAEQIGCYIEIAIDLMVRTSGSRSWRCPTSRNAGSSSAFVAMKITRIARTPTSAWHHQMHGPYCRESVTARCSQMWNESCRCICMRCGVMTVS